MPSTFTVSVIYALISVVVAGAWVAGFLDKYQKMAQNAILGTMGDNRMSYGLKSTIKSQQTGNADLDRAQSDTADVAGGLVGKGGIGEGIGSTVSKGL